MRDLGGQGAGAGTIPVRLARAHERDALSELCLRSKGHWGYDAAFLAMCRDELTVGEEAMRDGRVLVAVARDGAKLGVAQTGMQGEEAALDLLFVEPSAMRRGVGRTLLRASLDLACARGACRMRVAADPSAAAFYERMGARRVGVEPSHSIRGRHLPLFEIATQPPAMARAS